MAWGADGLRLLPEIGRIEDVYLLRAIHEGLKRVSTPEELRRIYQPASQEYWRLLPTAEPYRPGASGWHLSAILSGVECALMEV
ncbi:MAG: hypothetical protein FJ011_27565 [Chloroflexi bacterium]|nr:hypothetical protein [Chloroflexota bacterium]